MCSLHQVILREIRLMCCYVSWPATAKLKDTEITVGNNPSYFAFGRGGLVYLVNEVDSFEQKAGGGITTLAL